MNGRTDRLREAAWYADKLWSGQHWRAMMALCSRAMEEDGEDAGMLLRRGRSLLAMGREVEAERDLKRAVALAPQLAAALTLLCEIALRRRQLPVAEVFIRHALRREPNDARTLEVAKVVAGWRAAVDARALRRERAQSSAATGVVTTPLEHAVVQAAQAARAQAAAVHAA